MDDNYIDQYGDNNRPAKKEKSDSYYIPPAMAGLNFMIFVAYLWSAYHSRGKVMALIAFVPIFSIIGMVFSYTTRHSREKHLAIWLFGLIGCVISFILINLLFLGNMLALAQD